MAKTGRGNSLRIIGGRWRGRKLHFPPIPGLRPTPDRVRETVFNWLQPWIFGARCLDLFAGSGAFGLEALSRGAREVVLVDRDPRVVRALTEHLRVLEVSHSRVVRADVLDWLEGQNASQPFHLVFLDPPYGHNLLAPCCRSLERGGWLYAGARIYLEAERQLGTPVVPSSWVLVRSQQAGQVGYHLAIREIVGNSAQS